MAPVVFASLAFGISLLALACGLGAVWYTRQTAGPVLAVQQQQLAHEFTEQIKGLQRDFAGLTSEWGDALDKVTVKQKQAQAAAARAARGTGGAAAGPDGFDPGDPNADRAQLGAWLREQGRM